MKLTLILKQEQIAEYQRVSSGGQDLQMQVSANSQYLKNYDPNCIQRFIDYDVSATKVDLKKRPALNRMINFIRQGKITIVIVYERDRLARDVYEYIHIVKELNKHNVKVIFTATDAPAFSDDLFLETWFGLQAQFEGQRIDTRLYDARKRNPPSMIGYKKVITKDKKRYYQPIEKSREVLNNLFSDFADIRNREDLYRLVIKYKPLLHRSENRIIKILKTPFFAASYFDSDGNYQLLDNVEPIITIELFKNVQDKIEEFEKSINKGFTVTMKESKITPICGICNTELSFKKGDFGNISTYVCKKHRKIKINTDELTGYIINANVETLEKLSYLKMNTACGNGINKLISELNQQLKALQNTIEDECIAISQKYLPNKQKTKKLAERLLSLEKYKNEIYSNHDQVELLSKLKSEIKIVTEYVKDKLIKEIDEDEHLLLSELMISSITIFKEHLVVEHYFSEFWEGEASGE